MRRRSETSGGKSGFADQCHQFVEDARKRRNPSAAHLQSNPDDRKIFAGLVAKHLVQLSEQTSRKQFQTTLTGIVQRGHDVKSLIRARTRIATGRKDPSENYFPMELFEQYFKRLLEQDFKEAIQVADIIQSEQKNAEFFSALIAQFIEEIQTQNVKSRIRKISTAIGVALIMVMAKVGHHFYTVGEEPKQLQHQVEGHRQKEAEEWQAWLRNPSNPYMWQKKAEESLQQKDVDGAIASFTKAIRIYQEWTKSDDDFRKLDGHYNMSKLLQKRAQLHSGQGKHDEAIADYTSMMQSWEEQHPEQRVFRESAAFLRAREYERAGQLRKAIAEYERMVEGELPYPVDPNPARRLSIIYSTSADPQIQDEEKAAKYAELAKQKEEEKRERELRVDSLNDDWPYSSWYYKDERLNPSTKK